MRNKFDEQLELLNNELTKMGAICEELIQIVSNAVTSRDTSAIDKVKPLDETVDRMERDIENLCLKLLLQQQPVAKDLRQVLAGLKMITDMERIGDQTYNIAEIIDHMGKENLQEFTFLPDMADTTAKMVISSVEACVRSDMELAFATIKRDDEVDNYFSEAKKTLIDYIMSHPDNADLAIDYLMIAKYFERIGDHATNICEWVIFVVSNKFKGEY